MNSIGNDIVDLYFINKVRTESRPFYSKILSENEQQLYKIYFNSIPFWQYVWLLWSCKEAVYKFAKRLQPDLVFSPVKIGLRSEFLEFENLQNDKLLLNFAFQDIQYYTTSIITENYIATVANDTSDFSTIISNVNHINSKDSEHQSAEVRTHLLKKLNANLPDQNFEITKSEVGYPVVLNSGVKTDIVVSFAHHGNYVAYALRAI